MNTSELINTIASEAGFSKADATRALNATTEAIIGSMADGEDVQITGFGRFVVRNRAADTGLVSVQIAEYKVAAFKAGKVLKQSLS